MTVRVSKPEFNLREKLSELDKPTGLKGNELMRSDTSQDARDLISAGRKNLIINGAMQVAQRGTSSTTAITGNTFVCDRFRTGGNSQIGVVTASQTTTNLPAGFDHALRYECTTADTSIAAGDHFGIMYVPESQDLARIAKGTSSAKPITLSFYVRSNVQRTFVVEITDSSNSRHINFQKIVATTNTWERMVINIPADTSGSFGTGDSKAGEINWWLAAGSTYTSGSTQSAWTSRSNANIMVGTQNLNDTVGNFIEITGVQLEVSDVATEFEHRSRQEELALCYRYYRRFSPYSPSGTDNYCGFGVGLVNQAGGGLWTFPLDIPMRDRPSITQNNLRIYDGSNNQNITAMNTNRSSQTSIWVEPYSSSQGFTIGRAFIIGGNNTAGGYVELDAEL